MIAMPGDQCRVFHDPGIAHAWLVKGVNLSKADPAAPIAHLHKLNTIIKGSCFWSRQQLDALASDSLCEAFVYAETNI